MTAREDGAAAGSGPNADTPVRFVRGIGPQRAAALAAAGLATAGDLLFHLPSRYDDWRSEQPAAAVRSEGPWTVRGELRDLRVVRTRRRGLALVRAVACDASGGVPVIWFNQPYLANRVVPGTVYRLHGAARPSEGGRWELVNPSLRPVGEGEPPRGLVPVYPPLKGIGPATFARVLPTLLPLLDRAGELPEPLPPSLLARRGLPPLPDALRSLHRPPTAPTRSGSWRGRARRARGSPTESSWSSSSSSRCCGAAARRSPSRTATGSTTRSARRPGRRCRSGSPARRSRCCGRSWTT
ncbi:MAG: hypothetical protein M5U13_06345 [Thermoanaerobaculia bacterium]|nr:hypothetical protein [Thermoanaerobaculia bacterium]